MQLTWRQLNPQTQAEPILILGPSLGGNCEHQWATVIERLADNARLIITDLPGHADTPAWDDGTEPTLDALAADYAQLSETLIAEQGDRPVFFAGLSITGATGLHLARDYAERFAAIVTLGSAAKVGEPEGWLERAAQVEAAGTTQLIAATEQRWFTPAFRAKGRGEVELLMADLCATDDHSYAQLCRALAVHDLRSDLALLSGPLLLVAGAEDGSTPLASIELVAEQAPDAHLHVLPDVAHQIPLGAPGDVAALLLNLLERPLD